MGKDDARPDRAVREHLEQGYADAQYNLGLKYDNGQGVPQDYAEAVKLYREVVQGSGTGRRPTKATPAPSTTSVSCTATVATKTASGLRTVVRLAEPGSASNAQALHVVLMGSHSVPCLGQMSLSIGRSAFSKTVKYG